MSSVVSEQKTKKEEPDKDETAARDLTAAAEAAAMPMEPEDEEMEVKTIAGVPDDQQPPVPILYVPGGSMPKLKSLVGRTIEARIHARYLTTKNKEVVTRQLWGSDVYTDDSDAVCILMHTGRMIMRASPPAGVLGISAFFRVLPGKAGYESTTRYSFRSRSWAPHYHKCSLELVRTEKIENMAVLQGRLKGDGVEETHLHKMATAVAGRPSKVNKRAKFVPDVTFVFNSANDPCLKYCLGLVGDRGMDPSEWTSWRLKREVLYLEMPPLRYELAREPNDDPTRFDTYRWSRVLAPPVFESSLVPSPAATKKIGSKKRKGPESSSAPAPQHASVPAKESDLKVLEKGLAFDEIEWGPSSIRVRGHEYEIMSVQFRAITAAAP